MASLDHFMPFPWVCRCCISASSSLGYSDDSKTNEGLFSVNEIVAAWASLEVLLVSGVAIFELGPVSKGMLIPIKFICNPLEAFLKDTLVLWLTP